MRLRDVIDESSFIGRVQAIDKVTIRARIDGFLASRGFDEGGEVKRDQVLFTLGDQAQAMQGRHFATIEALNAAVLQALPQAESVLVKGSRFMKMERVVEAITARAQQEHDKETPDAR